MGDVPNISGLSGAEGEVSMDHIESLLSAQGVVERYKISYQTLNYYTNLGLLRVVRREGNRRFYNHDEVSQRLQDIRRLKDDGYPLRLVCRMVGAA